MFITATCVDPLYTRPIVESSEDVTDPVPLRKVVGRFDGTNKRFTVYLPPKREFGHRFFQTMYPVGDENASASAIGFAVASGGYLVKTNSGGYRVEAAAAKFARTIAAAYYSTDRRIYGYAWGGSGGAYQVISAAERTSGVWDGLVPVVAGPPSAIPSFFFIRGLARLVLGSKTEQLADAVAPGGSDPRAVLDDVQHEVFDEVSRFGVPIRMWEDPAYVLGLVDSSNDSSSVLAADVFGFLGVLQRLDPTYAQAFWTEPGYLGTERSPLGDLIRAARITHDSSITAVDRDAAGQPVAIVLDSAPDDAGALPGQIALGSGERLDGRLDVTTRRFTLGAGNSPETLAAVDSGVPIRYDNGLALAAVSYSRHQIPATGYAGFDQYMGADGRPLYPQRPIELGPEVASWVTDGASPTGTITAKMIQVGNVLDTDAYPLASLWYADRVRAALGTAYDDTYRLWLNDNADHLDTPGGRTHSLIDYNGITHQALRDVAAWVEHGVPPAKSTEYTVSGGQVAIPADAVDRGGVQPVVTLSARGADVIAHVGETVEFTAHVAVPAGTGALVELMWSPTGDGESVAIPIGAGAPASVDRTVTATFDTPGTYYPRIKAVAQRDGDRETRWARIENLDRVRVVVR